MDVSAISGLMTLSEAAKALNVSHSLVARYVRENRLPAIDLGCQKLVPEAAVKAFDRRPPGRPRKDEHE
jgi:excisionase family DNA binding protein